METSIIIIIYIVVAALTLGLRNGLVKSIRLDDDHTTNAAAIMYWSEIIILLILVLTYCFILLSGVEQLPEISLILKGAAAGILTGVLAYFGIRTMLKGIDIESTGVTVTLTQSFPIMVVLISLIGVSILPDSFLDRPGLGLHMKKNAPSLNVIIGGTILLVGIAFLTLKKGFAFNKNAKYGLLAMFFYSIFVFSHKEAAVYAGAVLANVFVRGTMLVIARIDLKTRNYCFTNPIDMRTKKLLLIIGVVTAGGMIALTVAYRNAHVSLVSSVLAFSIPIAAITSTIAAKEKMRWQIWVGLIITVVAIILIAFESKLGIF